LKEPVGLRLSSLKYRVSENLTKGVQPSPKVMMSLSLT